MAVASTTISRPTVETEKGFQAAVRELAQLYGWLVYHTYDSCRSPSGFPDLLLAKPGRLVFLELKSAKGKLTPSQRTWMDLLQTLPKEVEARLCRPGDWDAIVACLSRQ